MIILINFMTVSYFIVLYIVYIYNMANELLIQKNIRWMYYTRPYTILTLFIICD